MTALTATFVPLEKFHVVGRKEIAQGLQFLAL